MDGFNQEPPLFDVRNFENYYADYLAFWDIIQRQLRFYFNAKPSLYPIDVRNCCVQIFLANFPEPQVHEVYN